MPRKKPASTLSFTNVEKVFFPSGFTKGEMLRYYLEVGPFILPHLRDRPITLIRFPDGVRGESFYEKNAPGFAPEWIKTYKVPRREHEGFINYILVNDVQTLAWCANLAAIEFHPFLHQVPALDQPTHIAFDLDPGEGADIFTCAEVAFLLRDVFAGVGLKAFPKVSGSKGIQLYVPLHTRVTYDNTQPFAKTVAELMEKQHPKLVVSQMPKALRKGRVLIDWSQNSQSKTTVSVYSMRAKRDEPYVSMPVTWNELEKAAGRRDRDALFFPPDDALTRLKKQGDLFAPVLELKQSLPEEFLQLAPKKKRSSSLQRYAEKRDFSKTAEPEPTAPRRSRQGSTRRFVIQKHAASHLHYDFRLEMDDTLKSWAVPKGLPYELGVKRSAFQTEDHPIDYLEFEGTIPAGQYGGGTVMVWDIGTYDLIGGDWRKGDLKLWLNGRKLKGEWHIFRIKSDDAKPVWLVQKSGKPFPALSAQEDDRSVLTGRSMEKIAADNDAQWQSNRSEKRSSAPSAATRRAASSTPSTPIPSPQFIEPMAAVPVTALPEGPEWMYEVKWDGYRAIGLKEGEQVKLLSRNGKSLLADFPRIGDCIRTATAKTAVIDGEIVALGKDGKPSFQDLQNRGKSGSALVFYAFDLLEHDGESLVAQPLSARRARLEQVITGSDMRLSAELPGSAAEVVEAVSKMGLEGVIAKRRDSAYKSGERHSDWKKLRLSNEQEFVIGGFKPGMKPFESILVGYYEGKKLMFASKVRPGFDARSRAAVWELIKDDETDECPFANLPDTDKKGRWGEGITAADMKDLRWVRPRHVVQIAFVEWTNHGHLRHAKYVGIRKDKKPRDVVRESS
jgi:bifunctional non-homologous end joining protein LigD